MTVDLPEYIPRSADTTLPTFGGPPCTACSANKVAVAQGYSTSGTTPASQSKQKIQCQELCAICYSPCEMADRPDCWQFGP